jgi:sugar/nucleoside kinase (ribokinase family)
MAAAYCGRVVSLGAHIVDILGRPVTEIPPGQGRLLLDEIRITAAGTAAGTSVDLVKLGAEVIAMGAIGDDMLADLLTSLMAGYGVQTRRLARKPGLRTSATILPIRPNGERPALHVPGATAALTLDDVDLDTIASADVLHVGAPDVLGRFGGEPVSGVLRFARERGLITTVDVLSRCDAATWERLRPTLRDVQYFLPNDDQLAGMTGTKDLTTAARMVLAQGPEAVLVSRGADGARLVTAAQELDLPAFPVQVVDTTGCGDAVTAGFITGLLRGWPIEDASWLAMAAASLVASGLGSDAGIVDYAGTIDVLRTRAPGQVLRRLDPPQAVRPALGGSPQPGAVGRGRPVIPGACDSPRYLWDSPG